MMEERLDRLEDQELPLIDLRIGNIGDSLETLKNRVSEIELTLANIVDFLKITLPGGHGEGQL